MTASPSVTNYYVGKGNVYFKSAASGGSDTHMGNCPTFTFTPKITKLDHFSSMAGVKIKDKSIELQKEGTLDWTLEEFTEDNLALALLGNGTGSIDIFSAGDVTGQVTFVGNNDVGPKVTVVFPTVNIVPAKALSLISNEWGQIDLQGDVLADENGSFGTCSVS